MTMMSFAGYFLFVVFCVFSLPSEIVPYMVWFDLVPFRLSCEHGWIRSESVNLSKQ